MDRHRSGRFLLRYRAHEAAHLVLPDGMSLTRHELSSPGIFAAELAAGIDDASRVLAALAPQVAVYQFEEVVPSIEDLFVQTVQGV